MNDKFDADGWGARLAGLTQVLAGDYTWAMGRNPPRVREVRKRYKDADGNTRLFIIDYTLDDGSTSRAVRMIRDDAGTQWDVRSAR